MLNNQNRGRRCVSSSLQDSPHASTGNRTSKVRSRDSTDGECESESGPIVKIPKTYCIPKINRDVASSSIQKIEKAPQPPRRERFDLVVTRPKDVKTKTGTLGMPINLQSNFFRLSTTPEWKIYKYNVSFDPDVEIPSLKKKLIRHHAEIYGGYLFDGTHLFTTRQLSADKSNLISAIEKDEYKIKNILLGSISMTDYQSLQILNIILRRSMAGLKLQLVGRNYFDARARINLRDHSLQLWPGYETSIRQHEQNILLCANITHKVMQTETIYDILTNHIRHGKDYKDGFRNAVLGLTVITDYNNKVYRINDVDFEMNPQSTFLYKEKKCSFTEYYSFKYSIRIRDVNQPLIVTKSKDRLGQSDIILLIPELCRATGLTEEMRSNFQLMRAMSQHTRMDPDRRMDRLRDFNDRLQQSNNSIGVFKEWNLKLDERFVKLEGRVLEPQKICCSNKSVTAGQFADWTNELKKCQLFTTPRRGLERWYVITTSRYSSDLRNFVSSLIYAATGMHMNISRPQEIILMDDRTFSYMKAIDNCASHDPQLILCLVGNNNPERYASIKRKCYIERAIPTQVITAKCVGNKRGLMSIATKVAIQINSKLGYTPWTINIKCSGVMTIGYDVVRSSRDRSKSFSALVATMDMTTNPTFYSTVAECNASDVLASNLWPMMLKALRQYAKEHNGYLPSRIVFYRDDVSDGLLKAVYEHEVKDLINKLEIEYKRANIKKPPMFAYIIVTKTTNTRLCAGKRNPPPGTIVDDIITLPERYDFYLVSQSVRQGTVSPTSYNVVHSNLDMSPDDIQLLTYQMTHLYYNWSGTTRVPAVCQYAKKLATLVATSLYQAPSKTLEKKLFYL